MVDELEGHTYLVRLKGYETGEVHDTRVEAPTIIDSVRTAKAELLDNLPHDRWYGVFSVQVEDEEEAMAIVDAIEKAAV